MGVDEILGADVTSKKVEANDTSANFPTEMNGKSLSNLVQETNEPANTGSIDSLDGTNGKVKDAEIPAISSIPKDVVDEWPAPKQIYNFYFVRIRSYEDSKLKTHIGDADKDLQRLNRTRSEIIEALKEKRSERSNLKSKLQPFLAENKRHRTTMEASMQEMKPLQEDLRKHRTESNVARERGMGLCSSEEELNELIQSLHYRIQHESNTLNQEKQLLKEIKQLEATREKVKSNTSLKAELENKKGQKAEIQDKMKLLGVNMDDVRKEKQAVMENIKQIDEELKVVDDEIASLEEKLKSVSERRDKAYETLTARRKLRDDVVLYPKTVVTIVFLKDMRLRSNMKECIEGPIAHTMEAAKGDGEPDVRHKNVYRPDLYHKFYKFNLGYIKEFLYLYLTEMMCASCH